MELNEECAAFIAIENGIAVIDLMANGMDVLRHNITRLATFNLLRDGYYVVSSINHL